MRALVDTHAVLWWLGNDARLPAAARALIAEPENELLVSVASLWEIAIKRKLGRLEVVDDLPQVIVREGFRWLAVSPAHVWAVRNLELHHRDPFDRLLVAQASIEGIPVISADPRLPVYGIDVRWT
ncbi:MAG: type II toxin-antitoxin system VapC family toxin [Solirubrobacterales bacterium]|nr:type II toxin-antitoxin system VapC family toxin [Solirubrobacterales bacterium]